MPMTQISLEAQIEFDYLIRVPDKLPIGTRIKVMIEPLTARESSTLTSPVSALGQKLAAIRQRAIDHGMILKSSDEILAEVHEGRAETGDDQDRSATRHSPRRNIWSQPHPDIAGRVQIHGDLLDSAPEQDWNLPR